MKPATIVALSLAIGALAACDNSAEKRQAQEQRADDIEAAAENQADYLETTAENVSENIQQYAENQAEQVRAEGQNAADAARGGAAADGNRAD
jgi:hypothetical protein